MKKPFEENGSTGFINDAGVRICTGSMMGRRNVLPSDAEERELPHKLHLQRVAFYDGCYDKGGAYWGSPANLWCAWNDVATIFTRADSRDAAKADVLEDLPNAKFCR